MARFILWRIVQLPLVLAVVYLITFALVWLAPGSPYGNNDRALSEAAKNDLKARFHAQSWEQFLGYYPWQILRHGDFGPSLSYEGWSVNDVMRESLPVSISLGLLAIFIALICGCAAGVTAALRRGGVLDFLSLAVALVGISLPSFVVAGLLIVVFSDWLHWFPSGGWGQFRQMILPAVALALMPMAYIARLTRVSMLDTLGLDFVRTARAKGLPRRTVVWKHAFRTAFLPVFTFLGPATANAMTGSFVVEIVFNIPGLGQHFVNGVKNRDQTLILGTVLVYAAFLLTLNLLVDIGYAAIDPRIEIAEKKE
ncbi:MAG TPA: ABC transporter permease [Tepidisphaeraceae bacterium]|jgi:oligopeptide transport system permease protein|nr:ABC transporter permease [Tepidisphaeraceae bacterium]